MARTMRHEKPKNFGLTLRRLLAYLKRHTPMLLLISLLVLISAGANVFGTYLLKPVVNRYILPGTSAALSGCWRLWGRFIWQGRRPPSVTRS